MRRLFLLSIIIAASLTACNKGIGDESSGVGSDNGNNGAIISGPAIGTIITKNGAKGVVFYSDEKVTKIVSVNEGANLYWSRESVATLADNRTNGLNNMIKIKSILYWDQGKYPAFIWCAEYGEDWYLPALNELHEIHKQIDVVNASLLASGHTPIANDYDSIRYYWSSTEMDKKFAYYYSFIGNGRDYSGFKELKEDLCVRAIFAFNN